MTNDRCCKVRIFSERANHYSGGNAESKLTQHEPTPYPCRRPASILVAIVVSAVVVTATWLGTYDPWSPVMDAWSATPIPVPYLKGRTPLEIQGAILIQSKQCRNCHALDGQGGMRGPALDTVATRLTRNKFIRQILQGGGNMPGYGKALTPPEVDAIVAFLMTMHPPNEPPSRNSVQPAHQAEAGGQLGRS
jgi:ubiquinol-cytochrome c reductase cytochrome b subunit